MINTKPAEVADNYTIQLEGFKAWAFENGFSTEINYLSPGCGPNWMESDTRRCWRAWLGACNFLASVIHAPAIRPAANSAMPAAFGDWFKQNYPADTLIHDPEWHAPKIYWRAIHTASAPAQPEAKGDDIKTLREQSEAWFAVVDVLSQVAPGWHHCAENGMASAVAAIIALAAPVPAAPADKPIRATAGPVPGDMPIDRFLNAQPLPQYAYVPADKGELPKQNGGIAAILDRLKYDDHEFMRHYVEASLEHVDQLINELNLVRADRASQAAIAQPSGADAHKIIGWGGSTVTLDYLLDSLKSYSKIMPGAEGRAMWAMREAHLFITKSIAAAPQPPSTGSIADDAHFRVMLSAIVHEHSQDQLSQAFFDSLDRCFAFIDTRTAALIAASKEQSGDAWQPIKTAPLDKSVLLWWRPISSNNTAAECAVIGQISRHQQGSWWNGQTAQYQSIRHVTHWQPLSVAPAIATTKAAQ